MIPIVSSSGSPMTTNTLRYIDTFYHVGNCNAMCVPVAFPMIPIIDGIRVNALKEVLITTVFDDNTGGFHMTINHDGIKNVVDNGADILGYTIIGVQPMSSPTGQVFNVKHGYKDGQ